MRDDVRFALFDAAVELHLCVSMLDSETVGLFNDKDRIQVSAENDELLLHVPQRCSWLGTRLAARLNTDLPDVKVRFVSRSDVWS